MYISKLLGGLEHCYFSIYIGNFIIPIDFHIFQGVRYTTNQNILPVTRRPGRQHQRPSTFHDIWGLSGTNYYYGKIKYK